MGSGVNTATAVIRAQAGTNATIDNPGVEGGFLHEAKSSSFLCSSQESTPLNALNKRAVAALADFEAWIPVTSTGMKEFVKTSIVSTPRAKLDETPVSKDKHYDR